MSKVTNYTLVPVLYDIILDPRVDDLPFMKSSIPIFGILILYLLFVKYLGPRIFKSRKPLNVNKILVLYNGFQILACSFIVYEVSK